MGCQRMARSKREERCEGEGLMSTQEHVRLDKNVDEYLASPPDRQLDQKFLELFADNLAPKFAAKRLLELGVGDQVWTPRLCAHATEVVSLDGSAVLLQAMRDSLKASNWTPVHTMFEDYRPEQRFDGVVATFVLEHVHDPLRILKLAAEHWLLPGGHIHVAVPHALSLHRRLAVLMGLSTHAAELGSADRRMEHTFCFTVFEMEKLLVEAGFRVREKQGFTCKVLPNADMVHLREEQIKGLFWLGNELPIEYAGNIYLHGQLP